MNGLTRMETGGGTGRTAAERTNSNSSSISEARRPGRDHDWREEVKDFITRFEMVVTNEPLCNLPELNAKGSARTESAKIDAPASAASAAIPVRSGESAGGGALMNMN